MAENPHLLRDIRLIVRHRKLRPVYEVDLDFRRLPDRPGKLQDFGVAEGSDNLAQAVILRLLTPRGELAALGHPGYGSRLHELIGERNTPGNRNLMRLHILEALQQEPRIVQPLEELTVDPVLDPQGRVISQVKVLLRVLPTGSTSAVTIGPFTLELEP